MKWLGVAKKKRLIHTNYSDNKKSRIRKWIYRLLFLLLLLLFLLMFNHFNMAIEALERVNFDQMNTINQLGHQVHNLQVSNSDLHNQLDIIKVKINGIENQALPIHNVTPQIEPQTTYNVSHNVIHTDSVIKSMPIVTTAAMAIYAVLKGVASFIPALP